MAITLTIFATVIAFVGTVLLALDVVKPEYLRRMRALLHNFSVKISENRIVPSDKRASVRNALIVESILGKHSDSDFEKLYQQRLKENNYKPDLNIDIYYRTFVYTLTSLVLFVLLIYVSCKLGLEVMLSFKGLGLVVLFLFANGGLLFAWFLDCLYEETKNKDVDGIGVPPVYKLMFGSGKLSTILLIVAVVHVFVNVFSRFFGFIVNLAFKLERFTNPYQAPRVLGLLLIFIAMLLQLLSISISM
jgi:hypothetical protein